MHSIRQMPGLRVLGNPQLSVVAFTSEQYSIYAIGDEMGKRGWHLNPLQHPPALHIAVTLVSAPKADLFLQDLRLVMQVMESAPATGQRSKEGEMAVIYGMAAAIPDANLVEEIGHGYLDLLYTI